MDHIDIFLTWNEIANTEHTALHNKLELLLSLFRHNSSLAVEYQQPTGKGNIAALKEVLQK